MRWTKETKDEWNQWYREKYRTDEKFREQQKTKSRRAGQKARKLLQIYTRTTPEKRLWHDRRYLYGLIPADYENLFIKQGGKCAIGGEPLPQKPHIDHDHETGKVRGLVCIKHNTGLGMFDDDWEFLERASKYIFDAKVKYLNGGF